MQNDVPGTAKALVTASGIAPNWFKPHWVLTKLLSRDGERDQAISEAQRAESLDDEKHAEVSQTVHILKESPE
jgi:hypothetical protein